MQVATSIPQDEPLVTVNRNGSQPSVTVPANWFSGTVRIDSLFSATEPARTSSGLVTFEPCARTAWHAHPLGQMLIVTTGFGLVQQWHQPAQEIRPGDVASIPPHVKHWRGTSASTAMSHIAIQEQLDGKAVSWQEHVVESA